MTAAGIVSISHSGEVASAGVAHAIKLSLGLSPSWSVQHMASSWYVMAMTCSTSVMVVMVKELE
jgi:hypothetical protein